MLSKTKERLDNLITHINVCHILVEMKPFRVQNNLNGMYNEMMVVQQMKYLNTK